MELVREEKNKKVFVENNKIYYMLNMGSYVGHRNRSWYASKPAFFLRNKVVIDFEVFKPLPNIWLNSLILYKIEKI